MLTEILIVLFSNKKKTIVCALYKSVYNIKNKNIYIFGKNVK